MPIVCCVLRSGGDFDAPWVLALHRGLREHLPNSHQPTVCLTNHSRLSILGVETRPLVHNWPRWWSKVEMFRPGLFPAGEQVVYMDLDTLPVGPLDQLLTYRGPMAMLSDFYRPADPASGVLLWREHDRTRALYEEMAANPRRVMRQFPGRSDYWYARRLGRVHRVQDLYPGQVVSYKAHARNGPPRGARLVCGHGQPRFSARGAGWAHELWKRRAR